jgi:exodeoxyribonuclease VII large subunit
MFEQMPLFQPASWSVTDLTRYLKDLIESDHNLADIWVQGEVSNFSRPRSGHLYFTIKDSNASLRVVMWRNTAARMTYIPQDGDSVQVHGRVSIYETSGQYQLYADLIRPLGEGALYQEFLRLKARLEAEGLFDESRKRPISPRPERIGIVTSPTGAALRDILNTLRRRFPLAEVTLAPSAVQGEQAPPEIVDGLEALNRIAHPDVILVARGGGSIEDLWAFNDEGVARAIASSQAPVISGVGHQTDFTIADFAADLRAPTPTAAAELATPDRLDLSFAIEEISNQLTRTLLERTSAHRWSLKELGYQLSRQSPAARIQVDRQRLDDLTHRGETRLSHRMEIQRARLLSLEQRLGSLNPIGILERGFAVITQPDGTVIRKVAQAVPGEQLNLRVSDGSFSAEVLDEG